MTITRCTPPGVVTRIRTAPPWLAACRAASTTAWRCGSSPVNVVVTPETVMLAGSVNTRAISGHRGVAASSSATRAACFDRALRGGGGGHGWVAAHAATCVGVQWISKCIGSCTPRKSPPHCMQYFAAMSCACGPGMTYRPVRP